MTQLQLTPIFHGFRRHEIRHWVHEHFGRAIRITRILPLGAGLAAEFFLPRSRS